MVNFLTKPGSQPPAGLRTERLVLNPFHNPDQQGVRGSKGQLGVLKEGTGEVGRFFPAFGQYGGTLMKNVRRLHSDQHSAGSADEPRNSPGGENVGRATCALSAFHRSLRPKHDGDDPATGGNLFRRL